MINRLLFILCLTQTTISFCQVDTVYLYDRKSSEKRTRRNSRDDDWNKCMPCYVVKIDTNKIKYAEYLAYYGDCQCGNYAFYYPNGKIEVSGQYKNILKKTKIIPDLDCWIRIGRWTYYNEDGTVKFIEDWKDNTLIFTTNPIKTK